MTELSEVFTFEGEFPEGLTTDLERYINQGGLLGLFTFFMIYLKTEDEEIAGTAAAIPACLFIMSSLHDDAIDEAVQTEQGLKQFLNLRVTIGDLIFTHVTEMSEDLPEEFDIKTVTKQFREIGTGQLREENYTSTDLTARQAINRVEERGSVWGELAVSPVEATGYYSNEQLEPIYTFTANLLFILTVVDDVEDIPEDIENDVVNIPLILHGEEPSEHDSKQSLIQSLLNSAVPEELDDLVSERETEMEEAARIFCEDSQYSNTELLEAWNQALTWYQDTVCTIPIDQTVPVERQREVRDTFKGGEEAKRRFLIEEIINNFPARLESYDGLVNSMITMAPDTLSPTVITMRHIESLVESVMTTNLEDALENLEEASTTRP